MEYTKRDKVYKELKELAFEIGIFNDTIKKLSGLRERMKDARKNGFDPAGFFYGFIGREGDISNDTIKIWQDDKLTTDDKVVKMLGFYHSLVNRLDTQYDRVLFFDYTELTKR